MPPDKYEDEIREILNRMDNFPDGEDKPRPRKQTPPRWNGWSSKFRKQIYTFDSNAFLAGMVAFALAAGLLRMIYMPFAAIAATLGVACLVIALALPMISRRYGRPERRWRGKIVDYEPYRIKRSGGSPWQYLWYRIKKFFRMR